MREVFIGVALAAIAALVVPAFAADTEQLDKNGTQQYEPGTGGQSKAGKDGLPGNKSGQSMDSNSDAAGSSAAGDASGEQGNTGNAAGSDNAKVPGLPGNKSGPSGAPTDENMSK